MKKLFASLFVLTLAFACSHKSKDVKQEQQVDEAQMEFENEKLEAEQDYEKQMQEASDEYNDEINDVKYDEMNEKSEE